jgi:ribonuclease PH
VLVGLVLITRVPAFRGRDLGGLYRGMLLLDLDYLEDSGCDTDMNVVMTEAGHFVEV